MAVELSAISAALTSLKAAKDIAQAMIGLRDGAAFQEKLLEFQSKLIDANNAAFAAQDERSAMLERVRELEEQVAKFEDWEAEKQRYQPQQFEPGVTVYVLKPEVAGGQPVHHACPQCYANHKARILQGTDKTFVRRQTRDCLECKAELSYGPQEPEPTLRRGSGGHWTAR